MSEIKPKNGICSRCGYGIPVWKKGNLCVECSKEQKKPDLKQIASASLSEAKTKNL
nr:MAG TPA: DnaK suppressor protein [Bacteriophage sp.]